ncbi:hypothetical protein EXIGLDRAFT_816420 [Exidia glandulosa HHB12029]|uniref:LCCL domain-containing protein n=1 Tax=Exidia glandulosa HHB12029 TaxID=1314781 RepID=A0A166BNB9_EXIGL|nr:hypothetical protein EXIGLDRAFT_816420 [Exidia glandulosa HHB12029]
MRTAPRPWLHFVTAGYPIESNWKRWTRRLTSRYILVAFVIAYIIGLSFLVRTNSFLTPPESVISCGAVYWTNEDNCGVNGTLCEPFTDTSFDFRCPANCKSLVLANARPVGTEEVAFVPLVVGGGDDKGTYRGDSFICSAAIHAGIVSNSKGGCGTVSLVGTFQNFLSSSAHGVSSTAFPSTFPLSMRFSPSNALKYCADLRNEALAFDIIVTFILFLLLRPPPVVLFWCLVCLGYWHITLFSDSRDMPPDLSGAFGDFLPALFVSYAFWRFAWRHTLPAFSDLPLERAVWYLPFYWLGVLFNITTQKIPIDRLLGSDIRQRPGALTALIVIVIFIVVAILNQMRVARKTGWLTFYFWRYLLGAAVVLVLSQMPGLVLRLHHYIAAILLMPLTAFPTRPSAAYQAFCLGMFLNGIAKFKFDSFLQTPAELRRDAPLGSSLPVFLTNSTSYNASVPLQSQTLFWDTFPNTDEGWNGYSLVIDDVQRYVGLAMNFSLAILDPALPHFFRLAFQRDGTSGDYTQAATLWPNGTWVDPAPGPA